MIIYADVFILENLVVNYFILLLTSYLTKSNVSSFRIFFISIFASFYSLLQFNQHLSFLYTIVGKIAISILIIYLTFMPRRIVLFFRQVIGFYLITILFGGMGFFIYFLGKDQIDFELQIKLKNILIGLGCSLIAFKISYDFLIKKMAKEALIRYIKFKINDQEYQCTAYVDTGNNLKEPFSGRPVVIVEEKILFLDKSLNNNQVSKQNIEELQGVWGNKILLIPYNSIGQEHGMLYGVIPDEFYISEDKNIWLKKDVVIGIYSKKISNKYSALLGPDLI